MEAPIVATRYVYCETGLARAAIRWVTPGRAVPDYLCQSTQKRECRKGWGGWVTQALLHSISANGSLSPPAAESMPAEREFT